MPHILGQSRDGVVAAIVFLSLHIVPPSALAQLASDAVAPQKDRLVFPLTDNQRHLFASPGALRAVATTAGPLKYGTVEGQAADGRDSRGDFRLRVQPAWFMLPTRGLNLFKLSIDADFRWGPGTHEDELIDAIDPLSARRPTSPAVRLTQAYALGLHRNFGFVAGLIRPHFGLGLVANRGDDPSIQQVRTSPFGVRDANDRNLRAAIAYFPLGLPKDTQTTPPPLAISIGWDGVVFDDRADWFEGDRTWQAYGGIAGHFLGVRTSAGFVYRHQDHNDGGTSELIIGAMTASANYDLTPTWLLFGDAEYVVYSGQSTYALSVYRETPLDILAGGGVLRVGANHQYTQVVVEGGYASGDQNPYDDTSHTLSFDQNYQVGMLMFSHQARLATAAGVAHAEDPTYRAQAPRGSDMLASGGAIQNARYLNPRAVFRGPAKLALVLGYLYGITDAPFAEVYQTNFRGGDPTGPLGGRAGDALGHEIDIALGWTPALSHGQFEMQLSYAWYRPGDAYRSPDGQSIGDIIGFGCQGEYRW